MLMYLFHMQFSLDSSYTLNSFSIDGKSERLCQMRNEKTFVVVEFWNSRVHGNTPNSMNFIIAWSASFKEEVKMVPLVQISIFFKIHKIVWAVALKRQNWNSITHHSIPLSTPQKMVKKSKIYNSRCPKEVTIKY